MPNRPTDEISTAVIDALVGLSLDEDGSADRGDLQQVAVKHESFANVAWDRYLRRHPGADLSEAGQYGAIDEGCRILACEAIIWLLSEGHLEEILPGRIRLGGKPLRAHRLGESDKGRVEYRPGMNRAQDVIHEGEIKAAGAGEKYDLFDKDEAALANLRASMRAVGYRTEFKILIDADDGSIIDGRQRMQVAEE